MSYATSSGQVYIATLCRSYDTLLLDTSSNPASGSAFTNILTHSNSAGLPPSDQPWAAAATVQNGSEAGRYYLYLGYSECIKLGATVKVCLDALAPSPHFDVVRLDVRSDIHQADVAPVRVATGPDGTIYAGYCGGSPNSGSIWDLDYCLARDDDWGRNKFTDLVNSTDNRQARMVAQGSQEGDILFGTQRPTWTGFGVAVHPNNSNVVYMCWHDINCATPKTHIRRSVNRGIDWSNGLIVMDNVILSDIAVNGARTAGLLYQQPVGSLWEAHFHTTSDETSWDDLVLARAAIPSSGIRNTPGDFFRLSSIGPHFYGIFPAIDTPGEGDFLSNQEGQVRYLRNFDSSETKLLMED